MVTNNLRLQRSGITLPEVTGVIACLGVGMFTGYFMFMSGSRLAESDHAPQNSSVAPSELTTDSPAISKEETELRAIQQNIIAELSTAPSQSPDENAPIEALDPQNQPIDNADIRALLGGKKTSLSTDKTSAAQAQNAGVNSKTDSNGPQTLAYWNAMNNVMAEEESMRATPGGGLTKENAADFIARRGEAGNYAATELRGLDRSGVDPDVLALGTDIAAWYERGTQLNGRAEYLMNQASDETRRGQTGKSWGDSEKAHNAGVADINRRGDALRVKMSQKYGLKFPDLR
jgi:hypothetical protein